MKDLPDLIMCMRETKACRRMAMHPSTEALLSWAHQMQVIGRIGLLEKLNGSPISAAERRDAEIRYLRAAVGEAWTLSSDCKCLKISQLLSEQALCTTSEDGDGSESVVIVQCFAGDLEHRQPDISCPHDPARLLELQNR